jgi:NAD(P)-dependent dehydrogenase (short-subunit alcohol dehydrogenase family)
MAQFAGKVAFVTGAGRGQGRAHAVRLAQEGADLVLVDLGGAGMVSAPRYPTATAEDLVATKELVEAQGRRAVVREVDVRDFRALEGAADAGADTLGGIDYVVANAGICDAPQPVWELPVENWQTIIDVNLSGVFHTCKATVGHVRKRGPGGAFVLVSSAATLRAGAGFSHYVSAKMGIRGLSLAMAKELGGEGIRCNALLPGAVNNDMTKAVAALAGTSAEDISRAYQDRQLIHDPVEMRDMTAAVVWLLSDEARFVTGSEIVVDGGEGNN